LTSPDGLQKALLCTRAALAKKATDVVVIEVGNHTTIAEYLVVCTGRSDRQVQAIAQGVDDELRAARMRALAIEGMSRGQWVLIDCGDVIVHVFQQPVREFYDLERLWQHAPVVELPEPLRSQAAESHAGSAGG
jgi:ribosome-associated protein